MNIFSLELRNLRKSAAVSTLAISAAIFLMLAFFPAMQTQSMQALAGAKLEGLDPALLAAFGLSEMMDFTLLTNFFGYALQFITLALMVVITHRAVGLFIKEEAEGTIEYLCAKPVSRGEIFVQKVLAHVLLLAAGCAVFAAVSVVGYLLFSDYSLSNALKECGTFYAAIFLVGLVFSAVGVLVSTLLKSGRGMSSAAISIVFSTFIIGMLSEVVQSLSFLIWLSPMDWIKAQKLLSKGILPQEWAAGAGVIVLALLAAWLRYRKKDLLI